MPSPNDAYWRDYTRHIFESTPSEHSHFADAVLYGLGVKGYRFRDFYQSAPLHGAIDFDQGPDGVWRLPSAWADGNTFHFGTDPARPGSDRTTFHFSHRDRKST